MQKEKYYITTAIAYTSKIPHIGNTYEAILADAIARYKRQRGFDVYFLTGTDEHGQKIEAQAASEGITPKEHVDKIAGEIRRIWDRMNVSYTQFIRTTDDFHEKAVAAIFKRLYEQDDIYRSKYTGSYCVPCESFYTASQLADGRCPDCGGAVEQAEEEAYFLRLSKYAKRLAKHIEDNPDFIQPASRRNEMVNNFIKPGLSDLCVSRSTFKWGIPVDFDPGHVVYVWIDALSNYITALGYTPDEKGELYRKYWPADLHLIGKDILRFHTIYWPVMLMALGEPLPKMVFGHPWLLMSGEKMSKSRGNVLYADELADVFGVDSVRYFVLSEMPFASDGSLTYELLAARHNSELANILGNLVNRTVAMTNKYFDGVVPSPGEFSGFDLELAAAARTAVSKTAEHMDALRVSDAIFEVFTLLRRSNKYIDETMPWILAKNEEDRPRLGTVLYCLLEAIRVGAILLAPFIPSAAEKIWALIGCSGSVGGYSEILDFNGTKPGAKVGEAVPLFARMDEAALSARLSAEAAAEESPEEKPALPTLGEQIRIDDFARVDLRCGRVISCEPVKKSEKLLKLTVDIGLETRQVVSGIAKFYSPGDLTGKNVGFVANLAPAKIFGTESFGMILAADDGGEIRVVFLPDDMAPGSKIR